MRKLAAVVFCLVCAQGTVIAEQRTVITSAVVDQTSGLVLVTGQFGGNPSVTIDGMPVNVISAASQMLVLELPASLLHQPGIYSLTVTTNYGGRGAYFVIAVGAIGPQGPRGEAGERGGRGDVGPAGPKGDIGEKGARGDSGGRGDKGDPGEKGDKGDPGTPGANGLNGKDGEKGNTGPAGSGSLRVVDVDGNLVGTFVAPDAVIVNVNGDWVQIKLSGAAFLTCSTATALCGLTSFEEPGCVGTEYMEAANTLTQGGLVIDDAIRYPSGRAQTRSVWSIRVAGGNCVDLLEAATQQNAEMKSAPLSALSSNGAFHIAR